MNLFLQLEDLLTIKSHHNVGGLPDFMKLKIVEPLKTLFKDEVRRIGKSMGIDSELLRKASFSRSRLAIRILGDITEEKVRILQEVDYIFISSLKKMDYIIQSGRCYFLTCSICWCYGR